MMSRRSSTAAAALVWGLLALPGTASAVNLQNVSAQPNPASVGQTVNVTVQTGAAPCAYTIDFGNGPVAGPYGNGNGTKTYPTQYAQPGSYTVSVKGKKKGNKPACGAGPKTTTVVVQGGGGGRLGGTLGKIPAGLNDEIVKHGTAKPPKLKFSCDAVPCVSKVDIEPFGTYADFEVSTTQAASVQVYASTKPLNPSALGKPPHSAMSFGYKHLTTARLMNLKADTRYYVAVKAVDENGIAMWKKTQFQTLRRKVVVTLTKVVVTKDGEGATMGDGDFMVGFHTPGTSGGTKYVHFDAGNGETYVPLPGLAVDTYLGAPAEFGLFTIAVEHDNHQLSDDEKDSKTTKVWVGESGLAEGGSQTVKVRLVDDFDIMVHFQVTTSYVP